MAAAEPARAALTPRPASAGALRVEDLPGADLPRLGDAWAALARAAGTPNPHFGPAFLRPLLAHVADPGSLRALAVHEGERLAALLPYRLAPRLPVLDPPVLRAFSHPLIPDSTPLFGPGDPAPAAAALLDAVAARHPGAVLDLAGVRLDAPGIAALLAAADARDGRALVTERRERAALRAGAAESGVPQKRLRELRRCERRLAETGAVAVATLRGEAVAEGIEAFLRLEASGWKGVRGTALACEPGTAAFLRSLAGGTAPEPLVDLLTVAGRPVAAAIHLVAAGHAVAYKCAYDEAFARFSPGFLLDLAALRGLVGRHGIAVLDSVAQPGHPVEGLWGDRIPIGRVLLDPAAGAPPERLGAYARRQEAFAGWKREGRAGIERLRRLRDEVRVALSGSSGSAR